MTVQWFDRKALDAVIVQRIQPVDVVLDIGCGIKPQTFFRPRVHICCEPHTEYLSILQTAFQESTGMVFLRGTWQEVIRLMPDKSVDSIFLIDVIEHLEKDDGYRLLVECNRLARKQIVVFTPLGFMPQNYGNGDIDGWGLHGGEWQAHKSGWTHEDFDSTWEILGSKVYHTVNGKGEPFDPPCGAFWAVKNMLPATTISSPIKLAIVFQELPPATTPSATALYHLLKELRPEDYCLLSSENYDPYTYVNDLQSRIPRLPARYYHLPTANVTTTGLRWMKPRPVRELSTLLWQVLVRARQIQRVIRDERCAAIVVHSGNLLDLPAVYLVSRWTRLPFYVYLEQYARSWPRRLHRFFTRYTEPRVLKQANGLIVATDDLRERCRKRYHLESIVLPDIPVGQVNSDSIGKDVQGLQTESNGRALTALLAIVNRGCKG